MKKILIICLILIAIGGVLFALLWFNNTTSISHVQVNGMVTTNSTTIPRFIAFNFVGGGTINVKVESGFYSTILPNDQSYVVWVWYDYKNPPVLPITDGESRSNEGNCVVGIFDLHARSNQLEYDISCPKM